MYLVYQVKLISKLRLDKSLEVLLQFCNEDGGRSYTIVLYPFLPVLHQLYIGVRLGFDCCIKGFRVDIEKRSRGIPILIDQPSHKWSLDTSLIFLCGDVICGWPYCFQFSKLVDLASSVSTMAGVTHRVAEIFELLDQLPENHDRVVFPINHPEQEESEERLIPESDSSRQLVGSGASTVVVQSKFVWNEISK